MPAPTARNEIAWANGPGFSREGQAASTESATKFMQCLHSYDGDCAPSALTPYAGIISQAVRLGFYISRRWRFPQELRAHIRLETNRGKLLVCGHDTTKRASRMNEDRRHATRVRVNFPARWEGLMDQNEATICDISITGCMVLSGGEVTSGELIRLEIQFPNGEWAYQWGEVAYPVPEIGFALRFTDLSEEEKRRLQKLIDLSNAN